MRRQRFISLVAVAFASAALIAQSAGAQERMIAVGDPEPSIETVGTGERRIPPDRATVMLLVESRALEASASATSNARAVQSVRDSLRRLGLDSAVTTASYNVNPEFAPPRPENRETPRQIGFVARTILRVQLSRIDHVGRVIDAALASGGAGIQGVFFESSTSQAARREALTLAAAAARQDAEALAQSLGGRLGPLVSSSTSNFGSPAYRIPVRADMSGYSTQIAANEIVVTGVVSTRWKFIPNR
jgi:uncharacterized protein YggE